MQNREKGKCFVKEFCTLEGLEPTHIYIYISFLNNFSSAINKGQKLLFKIDFQRYKT
jgi:hypothetical protein